MLKLLDRKTITIAKALVITSVVLGHVLEALLIKGDGNIFIEGWYKSIYLFHMPFYFILSGFLFKGAQPKKKYLIKKCKHLLIPYATWLLIFNIKAIASLFFNLVQGNLVGDKALFYKQHFISQLYGGMEVHGVQMILWFPMCLFFTQQLANYLLNQFEKKNSIILVIALTYLLSYINQYFFPSFYLPLAINVVCGSLPLFFLGYYIKKNPLNLGSFWTLVALFFVACFILFTYQYPIDFHMRAANYGIPFISTLSALGGFFLVLLISKYISRSNYTFRVLQYVGNSSMTIMYLHAFILVQLYALGIYNIYLLLIIGLFIPVFIHLTMSRVNILSKLFLGEVKKPLNNN
ncbi:acyltransferase family protein [Winogradskyella sediminis]|uniref:acyltransferase family protein n=1 Tax=Winogradskyella sediminis TaxID=1382466 RepID=UPI003AA986A8